MYNVAAPVHLGIPSEAELSRMRPHTVRELMRRFLSTPPSSSGVKFSKPSVVVSSGSGLMALDRVHAWLESADARTEVRPLTPAALSGEYPDRAHGLSLAVIP